MINPHHSYPAKSETGQSLVEFAITFMVLVLILSVVLDVGRLFFAAVAVREAAEEGALYGVSTGDFGGIPGRVRESSTSPIDMNDPLVSINVASPSPCAPGSSLSVTVSYQFEFLMPFIQPIIRSRTGTNFFPVSNTAVSTILTCGT